MATVIQLNDADFSDQGLPNIYLYAKKEKLSYAYDFRFGNFSDFVTGANLKGWLSDESTATTVMKNPVEITEMSADNLSIKLKKGAALSTNMQTRDYAVGDKFTALVIGGISSQSSSAGQYLTFLEMGNHISPSGIPSIEANLTGGSAKIGYRSKTDSALTSSSNFSLDKLNFMVLIFDGLSFTWINKTTGFSETKSLASIGITDLLRVTAGSIIDPLFHSTGTISPVLPGLFSSEFLLAQLAFWDNTALSLNDIDEQYALMKRIYKNSI